MDIYAVGIENITINELKERGFRVSLLHQLPDNSLIQDKCLIVTNEYIPVSELSKLREDYPDAIILYKYMEISVRGYNHIHSLCEKENIHFLSPRATTKTITDKLSIITSGHLSIDGNIIGLFGSAVGSGVTTVGHTLAKQLTNHASKVLYLGLNLFNPGYEYKPKISLDQLRSRMKGKVLKPDDFQSLPKIDGYYYLPGNFDFIGALDYQEDEIEFLLEQASEFADVVVVDFGSIPESAAYYVGTQQSNIRLFITHYSHEYRIQQLMHALSHLDIIPSDFMMVVNHSDLKETIPPKKLATEHGLLFGHQLLHYNDVETSLPLGKRELLQMDTFAKSLYASLSTATDKGMKKDGI